MVFNTKRPVNRGVCTMSRRNWGEAEMNELIRDEFELDDDEAYEDRLDDEGELTGFGDGERLASEENLMAKEDDPLDDDIY